MTLVYQNGIPLIQPPVALHADGLLLPVLVRAHFGTEGEMSTIATLTNSEKSTGTNKETPRSGNWRKVCLPDEPKLVSGWASLEHPDFQQDLVFAQSPVIYDLAVSSEEIRATRYAYGHFYKTGKAFTVLYVRSVVGGEKYQRIGIGKLYGDIASAAFGCAKERKLILIC